MDEIDCDDCGDRITAPGDEVLCSECLKQRLKDEEIVCGNCGDRITSANSKFCGITAPEDEVLCSECVKQRLEDEDGEMISRLNGNQDDE